MKSVFALLALVVALLFVSVQSTASVSAVVANGGKHQPRHVLFKRESAPTEWSIAGKAKPTDQIEFTLALKQRNLDILEKWFMEASEPQHHNYQNFRSIEEINDLVSPPPAAINKVKKWAIKAGVSPANLVIRGDAIDIKTSVAAAQRMFSTEFRTYRHSESGAAIVRQFGEYSVPAALKEEIEMITGLSSFPIPHLRSQRPDTPANGDGVVVPQTLLNIYNIPNSQPARKRKHRIQLNDGSSFDGLSQGVIEFSGQNFAPSDLTMFANQTSRNILPIPAAHVVGPNDPTNPQDESTLDIQMVAGVNLAADNWFWLENGNGWLYQFSNHFFNTPSIPLVNSISYGWWEGDQCDQGIDNATCAQLGINSVQYVQRVNVEFQKIGLRGASLIASSGDSGANGRTNSDCSIAQLRPAFPSSSPWVTSVGATELVNIQTMGANAPAICASFVSQGLPCISSGTEQAVSYAISQFASGGGFSNIAPRPAYQAAVVSAYLSSGTTLPPSSYFNNTGRGAPDVSANGHNLAIILNGAPQAVGGTSASSPIFSSVMAMLNEVQIKQTGKPLGFLNPFLYQMAAANPSTFTDITVGDNKCTEDGCQGCQGYLAARGWDPVTGLGTPNAAAMLQYVSNGQFMKNNKNKKL